MVMEPSNLIIHDFDLKPYTTFGIAARTRLFAEYKTLRELERLSRTPEFNENEILHIGSGSNLLFVHDFNGLVLHSAIRGIKYYKKDSDTLYAIVGAGEDMDGFIADTIANGYSGLENLSGIPGEVGASAVQNVGAYGVEAGDAIHAVECFDIESRKCVSFQKEELEFGYRDSIFKRNWKGRYIILRVSFKLSPNAQAQHLDYGPLQELTSQLGHTPTAEDVRNAILRIRAKKLPNPEEIGSAGSFFKNPVISRHYYQEVVLKRCPSVPCYEIDETTVKIPAGWLIEHCGLKGFAIGDAQVYEKQCLVIINRGNATADDIIKLAEHIQYTVKKVYGIELSPEVNYIDTRIKITILGSGTSKGVPEIGCNCTTCSSSDPHDKRLRSSILVHTHGMNILIDASPDFRTQALRENIHSIDAVLLTHSHYDHVGGLDDLRPLCMFKNMAIYARPDVFSDLHKQFHYCFQAHPYPGTPAFELHEIDNTSFSINGLEIIPISVLHGKLPIVGYRIGNFAYITDCSEIDDKELWKLNNLDTLIINALRHEPHFAHFTIEESLKLIEEVKPRHAFLTHLCHSIAPHAIEDRQLPENVKLAYDGMKIEI